MNTIKACSHFYSKQKLLWTHHAFPKNKRNERVFCLTQKQTLFCISLCLCIVIIVKYVYEKFAFFLLPFLLFTTSLFLFNWILAICSRPFQRRGSITVIVVMIVVKLKARENEKKKIAAAKAKNGSRRINGVFMSSWWLDTLAYYRHSLDRVASRYEEEIATFFCRNVSSVDMLAAVFSGKKIKLKAS